MSNNHHLSDWRKLHKNDQQFSKRRQKLCKKKFTELAHSENGSSAVLISRVESVTCGLSPHVSNSSAAVTTTEDPYPWHGATFLHGCATIAKLVKFLYRCLRKMERTAALVCGFARFVCRRDADAQGSPLSQREEVTENKPIGPWEYALKDHEWGSFPCHGVTSIAETSLYFFPTHIINCA